MINNNSATLYLKGIGILTGLIFGAGVFALPNSFMKAGLFWGLVHFAVAFAVIVFLHFLYGEVAFFTKGKHRFVGYVDLFLGSKAKKLALVTTVASYYGSLLVYGILGGKFLFNIIADVHAFWLTIVFFIAGAVLVLLSLDEISAVSFYLTFPIFGFVIYLLVLAWPSINAGNFLINNGFYVKDWFLPYGVWFFSLSGFAAIPEVRDLFYGKPVKSFKRVIFLSTFLCALFYLVFVAAVWGVSGLKTTDDALAGIAGLGKGMLLAGSIIGFLAVFTSYISLAADMKNIFSYDYKIPEIFSWLFSIVPPVGIYLFLYFKQNIDYSKIVSVVGAVGLGFVGVFIILMSRKLREKIKQKDFEQITEPERGSCMDGKRWLYDFVLIGVVAGVIYELWRVFFG